MRLQTLNILLALGGALISAAPVTSTAKPKHPILNIECGPTTRGSFTSWTAFYATQTVTKIKTILGHDATAALVADETGKADLYWKSVLSRSDPAKPVNAYARISAETDLSVLNLTSFTTWFSQRANLGFPSRILQSNPQHYLMDLNFTTNVLETIEVSGSGYATHLFSYPTPERKPFMKDLSKRFSVVTQQEATLRDGTYFASAQSGFGQTEKGVEVELDLWFPEKTDAKMVTAEKEHLVIEVSNYIIFAWEDITGQKWNYNWSERG